MFSLSHNFLKFAAAGAFAALTLSGTPTCADEMAQNSGSGMPMAGMPMAKGYGGGVSGEYVEPLVGPWSPHGSGITLANSTSRQSGPLEIVTSDGGGNLATATAGQLGLATTVDVANLQSQINHLGRRDKELTEGIATARGHGRTMTGADAKPPQAGIAGP
jgi:hypothetical protein